MTISATDIVVPVCSKMPLLYLLTQKVAQKFGYVLGIKCIFADGQTFDVDDTKPLDMTNSIIGHIAELMQ